jgi:hypothetical protein
MAPAIMIAAVVARSLDVASSTVSSQDPRLSSATTAARIPAHLPSMVHVRNRSCAIFFHTRIFQANPATSPGAASSTRIHIDHVPVITSAPTSAARLSGQQRFNLHSRLIRQRSTINHPHHLQMIKSKICRTHPG